MIIYIIIIVFFQVETSAHIRIDLAMRCNRVDIAKREMQNIYVTSTPKALGPVSNRRIKETQKDDEADPVYIYLNLFSFILKTCLLILLAFLTAQLSRFI